MASARKRRSPFGEISPLPLKTHVGRKEAASASEKTIALLKTQALMMQSAKNTTRFQPKDGHCQSCNGALSSSVCSFCDRRLCGDCQRLCSACSWCFCPLCSTIRWSEEWRDDNVTCLSCL